jgi:hypothetical protein
MRIGVRIFLTQETEDMTHALFEVFDIIETFEILKIDKEERLELFKRKVLGLIKDLKVAKK